ncbi:MAG TPA: LuxR C-terminal-related transcriptional regulator [Rugosimonospora sp.]|nr:LuxR C-terminal-related transcriptional regulator [Rugosimonospora sp.]
MTVPDRRHRPRKGNLPLDYSSFVGRRREIGEVKRRLRDRHGGRLVTLTGTGGVGKTRIAVRVGWDLSRHLPGGAWLARLSDVEHADLVPHVVSAALGVGDQTAPDPVAAIAEFFGREPALLVLDTCERLLAGCASLATALVAGAPGLRILATSREPLGAPGERVILIQPFPTQPGEVDAVELFRVRAAAAVPGFQVTAQGCPGVVALCRRLDGIPLAIELAAARLRVLSVEQIADRLDDRFRVLGHSRAVDRRHVHLRAALDWSYELCDPEQRALWARLSVFAGGFDVPAAAAVCGDGYPQLESLVHKSILTREPDTRPARYRMLDTIRDYGAQRLAEQGQADRLRRRHRDHYAALARRAEAAWTGPEQVRWYRELHREHRNVQAAIEYCLREPAELGTGQELIAHLWFFWIACGYLREGRYYLERALALGGTGRPRRWALWAGAFVAGCQGDLAVADALVEQCRAGAAASGDGQLLRYAAETRAMVLAIRGDVDAGVATMRDCIAAYRALAELDVGLLRTMPMLGVTLVMSGDLDGALALAPECLALCERLGERWQRSYVDYFTALALRGKGDPVRAVAHLARAVRTKHRCHDVVGLVMCLEPLAGAVADLGEGERAARLLGATQELWRMVGLPSFGSPYHAGVRAGTERRARELLSPAAYERAFAEGREMDLDATVGYALTGTRPAPPEPARTAAAPLTLRETQVAGLVREGLTDRQIARRLAISPRTAESHVRHSLAKLGFANRTQLAAWMAAPARQPEP